MRAAWIALVLCAVVSGAATAGDRPSADAARWNARGAELLKEGKPDEAVAAFRRAVDTAPSDPVLRGNLAYALERQGRLDEAVAAYRKVLELDPDNRLAHNNLGTLYGRLGLHDLAAREFEEILRRDPTNAGAQANLDAARRNQAIVRERQDRIARPLAQAEARPADPRAAYEVARVYAQLSDHDSALAWLDKALALGFERTEFVAVDPAFATLRRDPRFVDLLDRHRARPPK